MFLIYDKNFKLINFPDGVKPLDIFISSIEKERITGRTEGSNLTVDKGHTYNSRSIELDLWMKAYDTIDYRLLRDEVYATFDKVAYVVEEYQRGKRYSVRVDGQYIPERIPNNQRYADAKISCTVVGLPFSESIGTTSLIEKNGLSALDEIWGYGMGLIADDESLIYTHNSTSFRIYNAGDLPIHPFEQDLLIEITNVKGARFEMWNDTNRTVFSIIDEMEPSDKFIIDGANMMFNNTAGLRKTLRSYITLEPGWNNMRIKNSATIPKISFDFPFYYK